MAGRNHLPAASHRHLISEHHVTHQHHLEDRIAIQHREIQSLLLDNQRLTANHVALKQDLSRAQQELRHLSAAAANVKAERDAEVREVYERSLKMNAEVRSIDVMKAELAQVRDDIQKFTMDRQELTEQLQAINGELVKAKADVKQLPEIEAEIQRVQQEIQKGRAAIETEKTTRASNLNQRQILEKNIIFVSRELQRLHEDVVNAEKRAMAAAAANVAANPGVGYGVNYGHPYGMPQVQVDGFQAGVQSEQTSSDMKLDDEGSQAQE
ncbi:hypothetical protein SLEP1_g20050 [Rubroshorea leprosula]|uniref:Uncharacterized protein n=1 Tax=Rubroshorea leprosula TaxID=152421 RepID=A0AAV5J6U9_9ROSI|nr:hypothetical protein SLEP1_g20050 [Rubroshorea leprosula]